MKTKVAINGFGRIGRVFTSAIQNNLNIELVAINDLADVNTLAHLLKYDSVHGKFNGTVTVEDNHLIINSKKVTVCSERNPENLPWSKLKIDVVIESTGLFKTKETASKHITAGAKKVIISAPAKGNDVKTIVIGINDNLIKKEDVILSNASCTTNAAAPLIQVLANICDIEGAYISTVHSFTNDQKLHDAPHDDLRRARAATQSIIPTTTGAAKAITKIFPQYEGKMGGYGIRVPVPDGSLLDICAIIKNEISVETLNKAFKKAAETDLKGILEYTSDPIVSIDIVGNKHSCIFDANLTSVIGNLVKVVGWYDNEVGYSNRLVDLIELVHN